MKEVENWIVWNPTNVELGKAYAVEAVHCEDQIKFIIDCEENKIEITYDGFIPVYTYSLEGIRTATWGSVQEQHNDKYFFKKWFLYKVENSRFLKWALEESCGYYSEKEIVHYCIVTQQSLMDIVATSEPKIKIL